MGGETTDDGPEDDVPEDDGPGSDDGVLGVFDRVPGVGVVVLDADRRVAWVNDAFVTFFGVADDDLVGRDERTVVPEELAPATGDPDRFADAVLTDHDDGDVQQYMLRVTAGDGRDERWLERWSGPVDRGRYGGGRVDLYVDVTRSVEREREIERQRDDLVRLEHVNAVVRDVNRALIDADSRDGAETAVVEQLVAAEPFVVAVFEAFEHADGEFVARTWAGVDDLEDLVDVTPAGIRADAVEFGTVSVGALDEAAADLGVRAVAVVPVTYRNQVYGIVCVYAASADAFDDRGVAVLGELGDSVGHAINAIERRDALLGDQVVEVGLRSEIAAEPFAALGNATVSVVVEHIVPLPDGRFVHYDAVDGLEPDEFATVVERIPRYDRVRHVGDRGDTHLFEVTTDVEPPIAGPVADYGGRVVRVTVDVDELLVEAELPRSTDVRSVLDALRREIPDVSVAYHRVRTRRRTTAADVDSALDRLTDRQRTVFEAAYYGGYFDWPRRSTAEQIAASVGISAPTFHQHLRRALKKLLETFVQED